MPADARSDRGSGGLRWLARSSRIPVSRSSAPASSATARRRTACTCAGRSTRSSDSRRTASSSISARPLAKTTLKVSFSSLARQLQQQPAPAGVDGGVTVHRADGDRLAVGRRCDQVGLDLGASPLVAALPAQLRRGAGARARGDAARRHAAGRRPLRRRCTPGASPTARRSDSRPCLGQILDTGRSSLLTRLEGAERLLAGRDLRGRRRGRGVTWSRARPERARARRCAGWRSSDVRVVGRGRVRALPAHATRRRHRRGPRLRLQCDAARRGVESDRARRERARLEAAPRADLPAGRRRARVPVQP